jgi:hypothetical protein
LAYYSDGYCFLLCLMSHLEIEFENVHLDGCVGIDDDFNSEYLRLLSDEQEVYDLCDCYCLRLKL